MINETFWTPMPAITRRNGDTALLVEPVPLPREVGPDGIGGGGVDHAVHGGSPAAGRGTGGSPPGADTAVLAGD